LSESSLPSASDELKSNGGLHLIKPNWINLEPLRASSSMVDHCQGSATFSPAAGIAQSSAPEQLLQD